MQRPDDRRLLPLPTCFHAQDTEAAFVVVEGDPLDQPGDFLSRGSAFWGCGVHVWGFIFPRVARALGDPLAGRFWGDLSAGRGLGRLGCFRGAGSLCDHPQRGLENLFRLACAGNWGDAYGFGMRATSQYSRLPDAGNPT
jgi:hypothetical protein